VEFPCQGCFVTLLNTAPTLVPSPPPAYASCVAVPPPPILPWCHPVSLCRFVDDGDRVALRVMSFASPNSTGAKTTWWGAEGANGNGSNNGDSSSSKQSGGAVKGEQGTRAAGGGMRDSPQLAEVEAGCSGGARGSSGWCMAKTRTSCETLQAVCTQQHMTQCRPLCWPPLPPGTDCTRHWCTVSCNRWCGQLAACTCGAAHLWHPGRAPPEDLLGPGRGDGCYCDHRWGPGRLHVLCYRWV
jgi:hypothetical protein